MTRCATCEFYFALTPEGIDEHNSLCYALIAPHPHQRDETPWLARINNPVREGVDPKFAVARETTGRIIYG